MQCLSCQFENPEGESSSVANVEQSWNKSAPNAILSTLLNLSIVMNVVMQW